MQLLFLLVGTFSLYSQNDFRNGYIVNLANDTLLGQIDYRTESENYKSCIFKVGNTTKEYYPKQILGFGFIDDKFFLSQIVKDTFVEALVIGEISLYKYKDKYYFKKDTIVYDIESKIKKEVINGKIVGRETSVWRGIVTLLIADCIENPSYVTSKIQLIEKNLVKFVVMYNNCKGVEFIEFKAKKPWTKVDFGATVGMVKSEILHAPYSNTFSAFLDEHYSTFAGCFGLIAEISSPRINERISSQIGINFSKSSFSSTVVANPWPYNNINTSYIDLSTLSIPISLNYNLPVKGLVLNFQGGVNYDYHLTSKASGLHEEVGGNIEYSFTPFQIRNYQIGYFAGIGLSKSFRKFKLGITLRRFNMSILTETNSDFPYKTKNTNCSFFVLFR